MGQMPFLSPNHQQQCESIAVNSSTRTNQGQSQASKAHPFFIHHCTLEKGIFMSVLDATILISNSFKGDMQ